MDQLEIPEGGPGEAYHIWVEGDVTIMSYGREVNRVHAVFPRRPSRADFLGRHPRSNVFREAQVGRKYGDLVPQAG